MPSPQSFGKSRDRSQRQKRKDKTANGLSSEIDDYDESRDTAYEPSPRNISQEDFAKLGADLTPLLDEATAIKQEIVTKLGKWDHLMGDITAAFQGRIHVVKGASDTWGREEEQSKKITELEDFTEGLLRRYGDIELKSKAEKAALELKIDSLQAEKEGLEQEFKKKYEQEYDDRTKEVEEKEKRMDADHRKLMKRLEAETAELRKTLQDDKKNEIDGMKKKIDELKAQAKTLSDDNTRKETELKTLKGSAKVLQRAYDHLEKEDTLTRAKMEAMRKEFRLPEQSNEYL